jgi:hypothetical protein
MANIFLMNKEIARGMVCFFHEKKHSYLIGKFCQSLWSRCAVAVATTVLKEIGT